jgi:site-specific DNA recombinase
MENVCIYLRKSRADIEAEQRGELETLSKHRRTLLQFAKERNLTIVMIREELVSGESIEGRPEMKALLSEVKAGMYSGVLVMDIDRLGRGKLQDQGEILDAFKESGTKIITPRKTYDLNDEMDEEFSEFETFMARKELKIINRRLQRGRVRSVEDGNYIGTYAPYGYEIKYDGKERLLVPHPDQAPVVKMIFELYLKGLGGHKIAHRLNELGYRSATDIEWGMASVMSCIKNPVYSGILRWNTKDGRIFRNGKHEPLVSEETYAKVQEILQRKTHVPYNLRITNPLAGLIICQYCGSRMVQRPYQKTDDQIMCIGCNQNKSSKSKYIESKIIEHLRSRLEDLKSSEGKAKKESDMLKSLKKQLNNLGSELIEIQKQKSSLHDFLEKGVYSIETFLDRESILVNRITELQSKLKKLSDEIRSEELKINGNKKIIPILKNALDVLIQTNDPDIKNKIYKEVIDYVEYKKEKHQRNDEFTIVVHTIDNP